MTEALRKIWTRLRSAAIEAAAALGRALAALLKRLGLGRALALSALVIATAVAWHLVGRAPLVEVTRVQRGDAAQVIYATGVVEPVYWAQITALHRKRIVELCKCEGQAVKAGEVLARLDDAEEQARLREYRARLARLRADAARLERLVARNAASQTAYDEKLTQVVEYEARVAAQKDRIDDLALTSPMDGIVLRRDGEVGEIAGTTPGDAILWVGRPTPLWVVAEVNEEDIIGVRPGQSALLRHDSHDNRGRDGAPLQATVERVTPKGDPETKTFRAYLTLPDDTPLMIGMSVEANIIRREALDVVLVPAEALAGATVQIVESGRVARRPVDTGVRGVRLVEIRDGLAQGDVILSPFRTDLRDGAAVRHETPPDP